MRARLIAAALATAAAGAAGAQEMNFAEVERGRYLTTLSNCAGCHTDFERGGEPFAGGRALDTPFGAILSANITPDATGIGGWSREEFRAALRQGVRRDGAQLYPAMPYHYLTRMTEEDVDAVYAYLRTVPPVTAEQTPEEELPAPLQIRAAVLAWNAINFDEGAFQPDPNRSDAWNRGAYLVEGPAHCGACHTPKNITGGDVREDALRGGELEHWFAPNIRGGEHGGIAHWSEDEIVSFLRAGRNAHTGSMQRMGEVVGLSMQHLEEGDLRAIAVYLKSLDDAPPEPAEAPPQTAFDAGETIFFDNCAACHKADGTGVPGVFAQLDGSNKVNDDPLTLIRIVLEGAQAVATDLRPGPLGMPAFDWKLDDEQVASVISYVRAAWSNSAAPVSADEVADLRDTLHEMR